MAVLVFLIIWIFPIRCFGSTATSFSFFSDRLMFLVKFFLNQRKKGQHPFTPPLHVHYAEEFGVVFGVILCKVRVTRTMLCGLIVLFPSTIISVSVQYFAKQERTD